MYGYMYTGILVTAVALIRGGGGGRLSRHRSHIDGHVTIELEDLQALKPLIVYYALFFKHTVHYFQPDSLLLSKRQLTVKVLTPTHVTA